MKFACSLGFSAMADQVRHLCHMMEVSTHDYRHSFVGGNCNYSICLQHLKPVHTAYCGLHKLAENWSWA